MNIAISKTRTELTPLIDSFPSSGAFDLLSSALSDDAEKKDAIKKGGAIFAFTLKNPAGETADWHIDLKESGKVGTGAAPEGKKANGMSTTPTDLLDGRVGAEGVYLGVRLIRGYSYAHPQRRGLRQVDVRQGERAEVVHERKAEDQGRRDEGDEDGAGAQEGAG